MTWRVERHEAVAVVVFDRPPENLMSYVLLAELEELLDRLAEDPGVTVVVVTGAVPGYFVGHADLDDVAQLVYGRLGPGDPNAWDRTLARFESLPQPVVAAVNGQAWGGGCELALAALWRVAAESAHFRFVEVAAGAIPGAGGTQRLPRLVGSAKASWMILSGQVVDARTALAMGLVDAVLPDDGFIPAVCRWLEPVARAPRHTVVAAKQALVEGLTLSLADGLVNEQAIFRSTLISPESRRIFDAHDSGSG